MDILNKSDWTCIPQESKSKYAIFFAISDNYSFSVANVLMGLERYSSDLMKSCDIIIYCNDISDKNKDLLKQIHKDTIFQKIMFPPAWKDIVNHPRTQKWGEYVLCKFYGFFLVTKYEKVIGMDSDMLIRGDIFELFNTDCPLAWRRTIAWDPNIVLRDFLKSPDDSISAGSGGLICFSDKLNDYHINYEREIIRLFPCATTTSRGGNDEKIIAGLAYLYGIPVEEYDIRFYNTPVGKPLDQSLIIHFVGSNQAKPWENLASFLYFDDWAENYQKWLEMGGDGPVNWTKEDYYDLLGIDKEKKIKKQRKNLDNIESEYKALEAKYNAIRNSKSWKLTAPLRKCAKWFRKLMKKFKKQH